MYNIEDKYYLANVNSDSRNLRLKLYVDDIEIDNSNLVDSIKLTYETQEKEYMFGTFPIPVLELTLNNNVTCQINSTIKLDMEFECKSDNGEKYWLTIPYGIFKVSDQDVKEYITKFKAYHFYYYVLSEEFKPDVKEYTTRNMLSEICKKIGIEVEGGIQVIPNYTLPRGDVESDTLYVTGNNYQQKSYFEQLCQIASLCGKSLIISRDNKLKFTGLTDTGITINNPSTPTRSQVTYNNTRLQVWLDDKNCVYAGTDENTSVANICELTNCYMTQERAEELINIINKINYEQYDFKFGLSDLRLEPLDMISFIHKGEVKQIPIQYMQLVFTNKSIVASVKSFTKSSDQTITQGGFRGTINKQIANAYSQIEQTNERITSEVGVIKDDLNSAVSKIEQTAEEIKSTVNSRIETSKQEAIEQAEINTNNQLQSYPTKTEMNSVIQQNANSIISEVSKIEQSLTVDNLLANGNFTNEWYGWTYRDYGSPVNYTLTAHTDWTLPSKVALSITQSWHPQGIDSGFTQIIDVKPNTNYTFTGYIASHRAEGMVVIKDEAGNWLHFDKTNPEYDNYPGGANISKWKRVRLVYYSGDRNKLQLHLAMGKSNENGHVWFHDFMVTEGDTDLCWKPSERETRTQIAQLDNRITSTVTSIQTVDGKVNSAQSQIDQQADQIASKVNSGDLSSLIQQNAHSVMVAINNGRNSMGIGIDTSGLYGYNNNIATFRLTEGKFHAYNSWNGAHMGYFGTNGDDLRACLYNTNTFSIYSNDTALLLRARYDRDQTYGNATLDMCGGINFIHKPGQDVGVNQILLGNDDRNDAYGYHNMSIRCWNSLGFQDNYGLTHMFMDVRRGRLIMKGGLYQNTQTPPSAYVLSNETDNPFYSGITSEDMVNSILKLETTVKVDTDDDVTMMILDNDDDLTMSIIDNQPHVDIASIVAGLVETVKFLKSEIEDLKSQLANNSSTQ